MPTPIPSPLPPWARVLIEVLPGIAAGLQFVLDHIGTAQTSVDTNPSSWRHVQWVFQDPTDPDTANRAVFTMDIANITGGAIDSTWTDPDYGTVEGFLNTLWGQLRVNHSTRATLIERKYYIRSFNPMTTDKPFAHSGQPERTFPLAMAGLDTTQLPPQCSISVTEKTAYPKHWGRMYLPFPGTSVLGSRGTIYSGACDQIGQAVHDCYQSLMAAQFFPVVAVTQVDKAPMRGLLTVDAVQVDNVFDVVRRRRTHSASHRWASPLSATQLPAPGGSEEEAAAPAASA